ncbi:MAG: hypothetical protein J2P59_01535 [Acidimicrobiales bacterium]|nr:hypothetical protein [Acidimicrobiales bacterium]
MSPGLQQKCVVCDQPTDTTVAFIGSAEWCVAWLELLGLSGDQAYLAAFTSWHAELGPGLQFGDAPEGVIQMGVQLCKSCADKARAFLADPSSLPEPVLALPGSPIPAVVEPEDE